jgi:hypothetical protein
MDWTTIINAWAPVVLPAVATGIAAWFAPSPAGHVKAGWAAVAQAASTILQSKPARDLEAKELPPAYAALIDAAVAAALARATVTPAPIPVLTAAETAAQPVPGV